MTLNVFLATLTIKRHDYKPRMYGTHIWWQNMERKSYISEMT